MKKKFESETPRRIIGKRSDCWERILSEEIGTRFSDYRILWKRVSERELVTEFPLYIQVEHSAQCNLHCITCIQGIEQLRNSYHKGMTILDVDLFLEVLNEAKRFQCPSMSFHNNNEPLLLKDIGERIQLAKDNGFLDLILVTNAMLLTPERSKQLIRSGITKINFSLDACSKAIYERIRIGGDFDLVVKNIEFFIMLRKSLGLNIPITRATCVISKYCQEYIEEFKRFWEPLVDLVEFQNFQAIQGYTESLKPDGAIVDKNFICNAPWQQIVIRPNGDVLPCCSFYGVELVLGNIRESTIYDIWNGFKMRKIRKALMLKDYSELPACRKCSESFYICS